MQPGVRTVPTHGQKLTPWPGTLGCVAGNSETGIDDMLAWSSSKGVEEFSLCGQGWGKEGRWGCPSSCGVPA